MYCHLRVIYVSSSPRIFLAAIRSSVDPARGHRDEFCGNFPCCGHRGAASSHGHDVGWRRTALSTPLLTSVTRTPPGLTRFGGRRLLDRARSAGERKFEHFHRFCVGSFSLPTWPFEAINTPLESPRREGKEEREKGRRERESLGHISSSKARCRTVKTGAEQFAASTGAESTREKEHIGENPTSKAPLSTENGLPPAGPKGGYFCARTDR